MPSPNQEIQRCVRVLKSGGTLLYPTDTIWGIGCDATNPAAVEKIFRIKKREDHKSLIILLGNVAELGNYLTTVPARTLELIKKADRPLTIIFPGAKNLASNVIAGDNSVAIRIVNHDFCRQLIHAFGKPIVSTSANITGAEPPVNYNSISCEITEKVDYSVDESMSGSHYGKPSRIIRLETTGELHIIRN